MQVLKKALGVLTPAFLAILIVIGLHALPPVPALESATYDARLRLESRLRPMPRSPDIVMITIDDNSQALVGRWPWPRQIWADVVDRLAELGAHAVFFDITFPDPVAEAVQTRDGRMRFQDAVELSITNAADTMLVRSQGDAHLTTAVPKLIEYGFRELRGRLDRLLPSPDRAVADSLAFARRRGMLTGGVATVTDPEPPARAAVRFRRDRELAAIAAEPTRPVTGELALWRDALALYRENDSPELIGLAPALVDFANHHVHQLRRVVVDEHVRAALGAAPLDGVDAATIAAKALPPDYLRSQVGRTLVEQSLSHRLAAARHLLEVPGRERLTGLRGATGMLLPTFSLARGYDFIGSDNELKDPDGTFRMVPLLWDRDGKTMPSAGLALFLRVLAGPGGRLPALSVEPGPVLAIERMARGKPTGQPPLRVPLTPAGDLYIHWAGAFSTSLDILPAANIINLSNLLRDREAYVEKVSKNDTLPRAAHLRERARSAIIAAPDRPLSFADLTAADLDREAGLGMFAELAASKVADHPTSETETRSPAAWFAFLTGFMQEREQASLGAFKTALDMIAKEPDPAKRAAREKKYAKLLGPYYRFVKGSDTLRAELKRRVEGKICVIGHTASSSTDLGTIAFDTRFPKVGSYANIYNTLATERFVVRPAWLSWPIESPGPQLPLWILVCCTLALILPHLSSYRGFQWAFAFAVAWVVGATALFVLAGVWVDIVAPVLGAGLTYIVVVTARNKRTEKVRSMFETYVDPRIVKVVVEDESRWRELGGVETRITAFFSDIANFTTLSEMLSPQEVSQMLTDYLSPMTEIILAHDGTRDKYIGDAIVAFFGAPLPGEGHELQACLASIEQQERALELKQKWRADGATWYAKLLAAGTDLTFRIGLNTGLAKVGNFGSLNSKNYTMIGDSVNLASRLEGANKEYGTLIMASETTVRACGGKIVTRELDRIVVKGRKEAVRVFDVVGRTGQVAAHWAELIERYDQALAQYHRREFGAAQATLRAILDRWPDDGPTRVYLGRCEAFAVAPPPDDWDGSFKMTHK